MWPHWRETRIQTRHFAAKAVLLRAASSFQHTHTHTHTTECKRAHTVRTVAGSSWDSARQLGQKRRTKRKASRRGERGCRMSQFADHSVVSVYGRIRNVPLLELLVVSVGPCVFPLHPSFPSVIPSAKEVSGAGGKLSGAESRSDWVIIRLALQWAHIQSHLCCSWPRQEVGMALGTVKGKL